MDKKYIAEGLTALGLLPKDTVMVHSSLSSFGYVTGGAETVVDALLDVIGDQGTLVVPTFSYYLLGDEKVWDKENTPSRMGAISEAVRKRPGAIRSGHAAHSLAAIGAKAMDLLGEPYKTGFGPDSPFKRLVEWDASILLMGVDYNRCTFFHLLEAEANVPYRFLEKRKATVIKDGVVDPDGYAWEYTRDQDAFNDFLPFGKLLEETGIAKTAMIGNSLQRLFKARKAYALGMEKIEADPGYLLKK